MARTAWPYLVARPGPGQVRACPRCGTVAVFQCWHPDSEAIKTEVMNAAKAAHLRRTSGLVNRMTFTCDGCGHEGPIETGMTIGDGYRCAACSGRTPRQVREARRQVAAGSDERGGSD